MRLKIPNDHITHTFIYNTMIPIWIWIGYTSNTSTFLLRIITQVHAFRLLFVQFVSLRKCGSLQKIDPHRRNMDDFFTLQLIESIKETRFRIRKTKQKPKNKNKNPRTTNKNSQHHSDDPSFDSEFACWIQLHTFPTTKTHK